MGAGWSSSLLSGRRRVLDASQARASVVPGRLSVGVAQRLGDRDEQQDTLRVVKDLHAYLEVTDSAAESKAQHKALHGGNGPVAFFGCFDGHGGAGAAEYLQASLHKVRPRTKAPSAGLRPAACGCVSVTRPRAWY